MVAKIAAPAKHPILSLLGGLAFPGTPYTSGVNEEQRRLAWSFPPRNAPVGYRVSSVGRHFAACAIVLLSPMESRASLALFSRPAETPPIRISSGL